MIESSAWAELSALRQKAEAVILKKTYVANPALFCKFFSFLKRPAGYMQRLFITYAMKKIFRRE